MQRLAKVLKAVRIKSVPRFIKKLNTILLNGYASAPAGALSASSVVLRKTTSQQTVRTSSSGRPKKLMMTKVSSISKRSLKSVRSARRMSIKTQGALT